MADVPIMFFATIHAASVFISASMEDRVARIVGTSISAEARRLIEHGDLNANYYNYYSFKQWEIAQVITYALIPPNSAA